MRVRFVRVSLFVALLTLAASPRIYATENLPREIRFDYLGVEDGLASSAVSGMVQDDEGFIPFATQSGLNRYDGYTIDRYENDPFDSNSLSHNLIQTMDRDDDGTLWLGTYGGLNRFDPKRGRFSHFRHDPDTAASLSNDVVVAIARDRSGYLWVGTLNGLNRLDPATGEVRRYLPDDQNAGGLPDKVVRSITVDGHGELWIGTYGGLSRYRPDRDDFVTLPATGPGSLPSPFVMILVPDPDDPDLLWTGTWDGGVSAVNTRSGDVTTMRFPHNEIYALLFDSSDRLWVATWGRRLYVVDRHNGRYEHMVAGNSGAARGLSHDVVYSFMEDASGKRPSASPAIEADLCRLRRTWCATPSHTRGTAR